jgi:hypothetical protein
LISISARVLANSTSEYEGNLLSNTLAVFNNGAGGVTVGVLFLVFIGIL